MTTRRTTTASCSTLLPPTRITSPLRRSNVVGTDTATPGEFDTANHNYDVSSFNQLVSAIHDGTHARQPPPRRQRI